MKKISFLLCSILLLYSCNKNEVEPQVTDPKQAILGKWEIVENSFGNVAEPSQYEEYLKDGVLLIFRYSDKELLHYKYWFKDSLLYIGGIFLDTFNDTVIVAEPYKYQFLAKDRITMDFQFPAINTLYIYKRIK